MEKVSKELQAVDISADYALYSLRHILQRLHEIRNEREFQGILDETKNIHGVDKTADGGRTRKILRWMKCGDSILTERLHATHTSDGGSTDQMRHSYYEAIDVVVQSIIERFEQEHLSLVKDIEESLLRSMIERGFSMDNITMP